MFFILSIGGGNKRLDFILIKTYDWNGKIRLGKVKRNFFVSKLYLRI